jgi:hypothetical protein
MAVMVTPTRVRYGRVLLLGVALGVVCLLLILLTARTPDYALTLIVIGFNLFGWVVGATIGYVLRASMRPQG